MLISAGHGVFYLFFGIAVNILIVFYLFFGKMLPVGHGVPELYNLFWEPVTVLEGATHVRKCSLAGLVPLLPLQLARF